MAVGVGLASAGAVGLVSSLMVTRPWFDASVFRVLFAAVLFLVAVRMVRGASGPSGEASTGAGEGSWGAWLGTGTAAGTVAAAVGVGGGVVLVPAYSRWLRLSFHRAVGTSSATIFIISTLSVGAYAVFGARVAGRPLLALGYVDVGTGLLLAGPAVLGAQGGAALAHRVATRWLRWSFAVLAVVFAGRLLFRALGVL